jgi:hypothetical protein
MLGLRIANSGLQLVVDGRYGPIAAGKPMTETSFAATSVSTGDFRVGAAISRSRAMLRRHFPAFLVVGVIASSPMLLLAFIQTREPADEELLSSLLWLIMVLVSVMVSSTIGQAVVIHAALQDMRRVPVRLVESLNVVLRRFWPLLGLALAGLLSVVGLVFLIVPGLILSTLWFVVLPACIVEQLGAWTSLRRSRELTRGHRWKVLGLTVLLMIATSSGSTVEPWVTAATSPLVGHAGELIWNGIWSAFTAIITIVTYLDLRVAKEGVDIEQIAVVFD